MEKAFCGQICLTGTLDCLLLEIQDAHERLGNSAPEKPAYLFLANHLPADLALGSPCVGVCKPGTGVQEEAVGGDVGLQREPFRSEFSLEQK